MARTLTIVADGSSLSMRDDDGFTFYTHLTDRQKIELIYKLSDTLVFPLHGRVRSSCICNGTAIGNYETIAGETVTALERRQCKSILNGTK